MGLGPFRLSLVGPAQYRRVYWMQMRRLVEGIFFLLVGICGVGMRRGVE